MNEKIDRPLVRIGSSNKDLDWYNRMMGHQRQLIDLLESRIKVMEDTRKTTNKIINTLTSHRDFLQNQLDEQENKIIVFRPWNIGKKKN